MRARDRDLRLFVLKFKYSVPALRTDHSANQKIEHSTPMPTRASMPSVMGSDNRRPAGAWRTQSRVAIAVAIAVAFTLIVTVARTSAPAAAPRLSAGAHDAAPTPRLRHAAVRTCE